MLSSDSRFQDRIRSHRRVPGPSFGGRSALKGPLEFYLNGHLEALSSENKGRLTGFGTSPEGVENNEILYELISAASWSDSRVDLDTFLEKYSRARYGECDPAFMEFWNELRQSVYDNFTNNARFLWQLRPAYAVQYAAMYIAAKADRLLESHPVLRIQRWLDMAGDAASDAEGGSADASSIQPYEDPLSAACELVMKYSSLDYSDRELNPYSPDREVT